MSHGAELKHIGFQWNYERESWQVLNMVSGQDIEEDLSEFTGLHDKTGKEIYEGDIMRMITPHKKEVTYTQVVHDTDEGCRFLAKGINVRGCFSFAGFYKELSEVIGNIYQNPELLITPESHERATEAQ